MSSLHRILLISEFRDIFLTGTGNWDCPGKLGRILGLPTPPIQSQLEQQHFLKKADCLFNLMPIIIVAFISIIFFF